MGPEQNSEYQNKGYWDSRYQSEPGQNFDWFKDYSQLRELFDEIVPSTSARIVNLGCGNSSLAIDMYNSGYNHITNVDFSEVVIEDMKSRYSTKTDMQWIVDDVTSMKSFGDRSFDVVIDKGTMDALMCEKGDVWNPSAKICAAVQKEIDQVARILRPGGVFVYITFGQPHFRRRFLVRENVWSLEVRELGDAFHYYAYIMRAYK